MPRAKIVLDLTTLPRQAFEATTGLRFCEVVEHCDSPQLRQRFAKAVVVAFCLTQLVPDVVHEGPLKSAHRSLMPESARECPQDGKVRRAFEVEHPAGLLRLDVLVKADVLESFQHLAATVDSMWLTNKRDHGVPTGSLVEQYL